MQVLSLIASFMALRQAILREESEKLRGAVALCWGLKETY